MAALTASNGSCSAYALPFSIGALTRFLPQESRLAQCTEQTGCGAGSELYNTGAYCLYQTCLICNLGAAE